MGERESELRALIESIREQKGLQTKVVIVENGGHSAVGRALGDEIVTSEQNLGVSHGRNLGVAKVSTALVAFLDDDGYLKNANSLATAVERFTDRANLGAVAMRIITPAGHSEQRHVPRLGGSNADVSGAVAGFLGGAVLMRTEAFRQVGGYDERFYYSMEEIDLAWRLIEAGWAIYYAANSVYVHLDTDRYCKAHLIEQGMRNRVWASWKNLPHPLPAIHVLCWLLINSLRGAPIRSLFFGTREGLATRAEGRNPMSWRVVWKLVKLKRPPIL